MNASQAYQTLKLKRDASPEEIKKAYRRLALESHPDKNSEIKDDTKFKRITEAYNILKNHKGAPQAEPARRSSRPKSTWGAPPSENPPEQDWSKFTEGLDDDDQVWWKEYEQRFWKEYNETINADGSNGEFDKAEEPKKQPDLFVGVDPSLCIGCCSCEIIAPGVFHIDKKSQVNPKSEVINMRGAGVNKIMNAAETCPTKAINIRDIKTSEKLYPH